MNLNKSFLKGAAFSFFGLLLTCELLLRWALGSGFWYSHLDPAGDMTSRPELQDRIQAAPQLDGKPLLLVFGDSVLGATALLEHRVPDARSKSLHHRLKEGLRTSGDALLDLGSDGLLVPDIEGLNLECFSLPPQHILLLLNFRMFAEEFTAAPNALSRKFLFLNLSPSTRDLMKPLESPSQEARLGDLLYEGFCQHWVLFRESQVLKSLWFAPSRKDLFQRQLEKITGRDESQADIQEAALKQRTSGYYGAYRWRKDSLPFVSLQKVLGEWVQVAPDVTVVLTPQNQGFLEGTLDKTSFLKNRKTLGDFLKPYTQKGLRYQDWADRYSSDLFLDHCHLTPEGNEKYAKDLMVLLSRRKK